MTVWLIILSSLIAVWSLIILFFLFWYQKSLSFFKQGPICQKNYKNFRGFSTRRNGNLISPENNASSTWTNSPTIMTFVNISRYDHFVRLTQFCLELGDISWHYVRNPREIYTEHQWESLCVCWPVCLLTGVV